MISKSNHVKIVRYVLLADLCTFLYRNILSVLLNVVIIFFLLHCVIKQLLDSVVVISRIFKVLVRAISRTPP